MKGLIKAVLRVNYVVRVKEYTTYEFTAPLVYIEDGDYETDLFCLKIKDVGSLEVRVANDSDFDIHDEVSKFFDLEAIKRACESAQSVEDATNEYIEHYKRRKNSGEDVSVPTLPQWIVLTSEGNTTSPNDSEVNNQQVLGIIGGADVNIALENFNKTNGFQSKEYGFNEVEIYLLANNEPVYKGIQ